jgi:multidrug resistance efflux pump
MKVINFGTCFVKLKISLLIIKSLLMKINLYKLFIVVVLLPSLVVSCNNENKNKMVLHQLALQSFSNELFVEGTVEALHSSTITCSRQLDGTIVYLIEDGAPVLKGDTVCIMENRESTSRYEDLLVRVEQTKAQYAKSEADLAMSYALLEAQVKSNEAQTAITNLDSLQLKYISVQQRKIKELELKKAAIEKAKFKMKLNFLEQINESELRKLELKIKQDENHAQKIKDIIDQMVMLAPQDGIALRSISPFSGNKTQEGDQVWGGMPIVDIPELTEMKVMISAAESEYKRIKVGDKVMYTFDGMPGNQAWGMIKRKAPMGKAIKRNSKVKHFEITATVDSFKVIPDPGLSANCRVLLDFLPDTVVVPMLAVFDEDSMKVVYVKTKNNFEKREIFPGISSPRETVVIAGLEGHELISFVKPPSSKVKSNVLIPDSVKTQLMNLKTKSVDVSKTPVHDKREMRPSMVIHR